MKKYLIISLVIGVVYLSCHKEPEVIEEPEVIISKPTPIPLSKCGTLDSLHSMFVINGKCWGVNPPQVANYDELKRLSCTFRINSSYEEFLSISQLTFNEIKILQPTIWTLIFAYGEGGDGILSNYYKKIDIDTTQSLVITYSADSTEISGKIKDITLEGGGNLHLGFPKEICISEGSFRMKVKR